MPMSHQNGGREGDPSESQVIQIVIDADGNPGKLKFDCAFYDFWYVQFEFGMHFEFSVSEADSFPPVFFHRPARFEIIIRAVCLWSSSIAPSVSGSNPCCVSF